MFITRTCKCDVNYFAFLFLFNCPAISHSGNPEGCVNKEVLLRFNYLGDFKMALEDLGVAEVTTFYFIKHQKGDEGL